VVLKIAPLAPLFLYLLIKKEWKICLAGLVGILFFGWALPIMAIGADRNHFLLSEWFRVLSHATSDSGYESVLWAQVATPFASDNQSLYGALTRWVWPSQENFIGHSNFWIRFAVWIFGAVSLLLMVFLTRQDQTPKSKARLLLEYSLFPLLMIFLSPVSEPHHYTVLFLSFLAACLTLEEIQKNPRVRAKICWGIWIAYFSFLLGLVSAPMSYWGVPVLGTFFFWGVLVFFLLTEKLSQS